MSNQLLIVISHEGSSNYLTIIKMLENAGATVEKSCFIGNGHDIYCNTYQFPITHPVEFLRKQGVVVVHAEELQEIFSRGLASKSKQNTEITGLEFYIAARTIISEILKSHVENLEEGKKIALDITFETIKLRVAKRLLVDPPNILATSVKIWDRICEDFRSEGWIVNLHPSKFLHFE